ncbi:MAG: hypothetical protein RLZZ498_981 [Pseudomonadota bacterium]
MCGNTKPRSFLVNFGAFSRLSIAYLQAVVGSVAMSSVPFLNTPEALRQLANAPHTPCQCTLQHCAGWESINDTAWPSQYMTQVATLRDPEVYEPTFEEHHPSGTRYESAEAPVALKFFPYNRCDVHACSQCQQHVLRYTEFGGYYVDHRARRLNTDLIAD